jgi:hypothetical protein
LKIKVYFNILKGRLLKKKKKKIKRKKSKIKKGIAILGRLKHRFKPDNRSIVACILRKGGALLNPCPFYLKSLPRERNMESKLPNLPGPVHRHFTNA